MLPKRIADALDATGLPYELEQGTKHIKIKVAGRLAGIVPLRAADQAGRATLNVVSQIRRAARELAAV